MKANTDSLRAARWSSVCPLFYRRWFSREPIGKDFVRSTVWTVIGAQ
jgi:hypothetical protein